MDAQTLATQIREACWITDEHRDSHTCDEAGCLISRDMGGGRIRILLPPGYTPEVVEAATQLLLKQRAKVRIRRLGRVERFFTERFFGVHNEVWHSGAAHEWKIFVIPVRSVKVGMPRGSRRRYYAEFA
jgi:hypothetical protein